MLLQIFLRNFYSNASCFSLVWLYLGNSQVSVDRTIGPTLVFKSTHTRLFDPVTFSCSSTKFKLKNCGRLGYSCTCTCIYGLRIASFCGFLIGTHIFRSSIM